MGRVVKITACKKLSLNCQIWALNTLHDALRTLSIHPKLTPNEKTKKLE